MIRCTKSSWSEVIGVEPMLGSELQKSDSNKSYVLKYPLAAVLSQRRTACCLIIGFRITFHKVCSQAFAWQTLAQHCSSRYDQLHARRAAIDILADKPLLKVDHLMEFAEWLYATGADGGGDNAEDMLLAAADILLELDSPEGGHCG